ncbi:MAG TPA: tetratricopeptide repeat protein [Candidatus Acidoferrum sp.]|nr:tetratricopeptide repeat protein [Candidatus Acidoferrum sp.]
MRRKKIGRSFLLILAALLGVTLHARPARALPAEIDELPSDIQELYDAGRYHQAAEALQAAVERTPTDASLHYWLGRCFFELREFSGSISSLERAVSLDPSRSDYHDWLGRACGRKADENSHSNMASALSLARRTHHEFETAVQLDPTNINAQRDLISFMASAPANLGGGQDHALDQIRALSAVDPVEGELALADLYAGRKKFAQASEEYQKILKSTPNRIDAYLEAADYYRDRDDSEHMEQAVEAGAQIAPSDRRLSYYRGVALVLEKKDPAAAEKDLRTYIETVPDNSDLPAHSSAYEWLGKLFENEEKPDLAAEQYKAGLTLDPQNKALREALNRLQKR